MYHDSLTGHPKHPCTALLPVKEARGLQETTLASVTHGEHIPSASTEFETKQNSSLIIMITNPFLPSTHPYGREEGQEGEHQGHNMLGPLAGVRGHVSLAAAVSGCHLLGTSL
jgi:hypothetical protein